jgi:iron complex transport system substrate-binding protein
MKNRIAKTITIVLALILMLTMAAGCPAPVSPVEEDPAPGPGTHEPRTPELRTPEPRTITIMDSAGREVEVSLPLEKVIVINPIAAEVVHALGASARVIGVANGTDRDESLPGLYGKPVVGPPHGEPDYEAIILLRPQLVITWGTHPRVDLNATAGALAPANIPVVGIDAFRLTTLFRDIELLGKLFEREKEAARLVSFLQKQLTLLEGRVGNLTPGERVRVYAEHHSAPFMAIGPGSDWHTMITRAGGVNIFADVGRPVAGVDPELVLLRNPQVVLKQSFPLGFGVTRVEHLEPHLRALVARPGWGDLEAVRTGRVYLVSMPLSFGPQAIILNLYMGRILVPHLLVGVDLEAIHREYFRMFHGVNLTGIFIYPRV